LKESSFDKLYNYIYKKSPIFADLWLKSKNNFGDQWVKEISTNISKVFGDDINDLWDEAVKGYIAFCIDAMKAMNYFEKHGEYKAKSYEECMEACYRNPDYMKLRYLPGQYLSHYIWPHHQRMLQHFVNVVLPKIAGDISTFYEVGVGCGMYSQKTLEALCDAKGVGYDISDYALEFTYRVVDAHKLSDRYNIRNQNIMTDAPEQQADFVISQEVLEHLEDPQGMIDALYEAVVPGGWGYITAAVNAAHTDHIYLYRSPEDVRHQIESAGWKVADTQIEENYLEKPKEIRPTIAGFLVRK